MQNKFADNSQQIPSRRDGLRISEDKLLYLLRRKLDYVLPIERESSWYLVLVDSGKKGDVKNINDGCSISDCGIIVSYGIGKIPSEILNTNFLDDIILIELNNDGYNEIFYVSCDPGTKCEIPKATSSEEIRRHGQILHIANDADPPEAVVCELIKNIYQGGSVHPNPMSPHCQAVRKGDKQKLGEYLSKMSEYLTEMSEFSTEMSEFSTEMSFPITGGFKSTEQNGWTLLHHAAHCGNLVIIRLLVTKGYDIHAQDTTCGRLAVHIAAREGHTETVEYFLNNGVSVGEIDNIGWTLLHYAAWKGSSGTASFLIENGAGVNVKDKCLGKTPLHVASEEGHTDVVKVLLDRGADIDDCSDGSRTAIYIAAYQGCIETVRFLFGRNANVEIAETVFGAKPLHVAAYKDRKEVLEFFLDQGADIQNKVSYGLTPLHFAAMNGSLNSTRLLVDRGADLDLVDSEGMTPFDRSEDYMDVASYLSAEMIKRLQIQGKYGDTLKIYKKLFEFQKKILGSDHTEILDTQSNLGKVMYEQGQYEEAFNNLNDVHARRGSSTKDVTLTKCELRLSIDEAQTKFNKSLEDLKEVFQKCEMSLTADIDIHDPLNVACDIASVYLRNREYDKMFKIFNRVLGQKPPSLTMVQVAALRKSTGISQENVIESVGPQPTKHILEKVFCGNVKLCAFFCILVSISSLLLDFYFKI